MQLHGDGARARVDPARIFEPRRAHFERLPQEARRSVSGKRCGEASAEKCSRKDACDVGSDPRLIRKRNGRGFCEWVRRFRRRRGRGSTTPCEDAWGEPLQLTPPGAFERIEKEKGQEFGGLHAQCSRGLRRHAYRRRRFERRCGHTVSNANEHDADGTHAAREEGQGRPADGGVSRKRRRGTRGKSLATCRRHVSGGHLAPKYIHKYQPPT